MGPSIDYIPPENQAETRIAIRQAYANPDYPYRFESRRFTRNGDLLNVIVSAAVYRDAQGSAIGMVTNLRDITERKRMIEGSHELKIDTLASL